MKTYYERLNDSQQADYSSKTTGEFRRQLDKDFTHDRMTNTDWESESKYYNYTSNRTVLKMKNTDWHKLTKYKYAK